MKDVSVNSKNAKLRRCFLSATGWVVVVVLLVLLFAGCETKYGYKM
jgi:hypothetical protein